MTHEGEHPGGPQEREIAELRSDLDRMRAERDFLSSEQEPVERRRCEAELELEALRALVRDFVDDVCPVIAKMDPGLWASDDWRRRAQRVMAGCRIAPLPRVPGPMTHPESGGTQ